jgi:hypothetical protein
MGKNSNREPTNREEIDDILSCFNTLKKVSKQLIDTLSLSKTLLSEQIYMIEEASIYSISISRKKEDLEKIRSSMISRIRGVESSIDKAINLLD